MIPNIGKNLVRDLCKAEFTTAGIGLDLTSESVSDSGLFGGGTTIDACDATTGWSVGGDGIAASLLTTSGMYQEGTGSIGLGATFSAGSSEYYKTVTTFDSTDKKVYVWFYISSTAALADSTDCIRITLGTSGFSNAWYWDFPRSSLANGWNSLGINVVASSITGSIGTGLVATSTTSIKLRFRDSASITTGNARMDYWRYYSPGTLGITDSRDTATISYGDKYWKSTHIVAATESNGLPITEAGDSDGSTLFSRFTFATVEKGSNTEIQIDKYYYID